jgi:aminobenzoyl-glutamate utilization protein B
MSRCLAWLPLFVGLLLTCTILSGAEALRPSQQTATADVDRRTDELREVHQSLWKFAEVGLEERKSSALLVEKLKQAGFEVKTGISGMPTAFVASYGSGKPVIGLLAEYDALPGLSQKPSPQRDPVVPEGAGHGCGHNALGAGSLGAALAIKAAMEKHKLPGTFRLYGTPAEETLIGKVYMTLDGVFDDLDVCLHWHPADRNEAWLSANKAAISAKFTFHGVAAHASGSPDSGRSALDGVELMNSGVNFMREHIKSDARIHYVITDGGGQPNVVPAKATVWYYCRADDHRDAEENFNWIRDIAQGAALMSRTKVDVRIDTDCHEVIINRPLSDLITRNLTQVGPPTFTTQEMEFARRLQAPLAEQFGRKYELALDGEVHTAPRPERASGSTDVGDISWRVPTGGLKTTCFASDSPGHSWQNVACVGTSIGEKGMIYAAKVLATTTIDLLEQPEQVAQAKADFAERMKNRKYTTVIPKGQRPPEKIR